MNEKLDDMVLRLIDQVQDIPSVPNANIESGSHRRNNAAAEKWNGENRILMKHLTNLITLAYQLEEHIIGVSPDDQKN